VNREPRCVWLTRSEIEAPACVMALDLRREEAIEMIETMIGVRWTA